VAAMWPYVKLLRPFVLFVVCDNSCKNTMESIHGLMSQVIKDRLFNQIGAQPKPPAS